MFNISKKVVVILILCFVNTISAQIDSKQKPDKNVPLAVTYAFNQKFPSHEPVWFSQYNSRYNQKLVFEGRFIFDNRYSSAIYNTEGNLIAFAATIERSEIPEKVAAYMDKEYPSFPISMALILTRGKNDVTYEMGIYIDNQYVIVVFSETGGFIKTTKA